MSDSVRPHRRQPTRLPRPWDSPGKNTGAGCHFLLQWVKVKSESEVAQLCPTLCDPMDCSLPGSSVHGILQARVLEWGAIAYSKGSSRPRDPTRISRIAGRFFIAEPPGKIVTKSCPILVTTWTVAYQAPLSMGFSREAYWSGLPLPSPGDLPDAGIESPYSRDKY